MIKLFGTDGVRGRANAEPMTAETALAVAQAAARLFRNGHHRHSVVIGKDTRLSGYMLEPALVAGFIAMGMDVNLVGPLPTPAVAMLTRSMRADLGVMISASHNPYQDNGIKLFGPDGFKLSDAIEAEIEALVADRARLADSRPGNGDLGRARRLEDAAGRYIEFAKATVPKGLTLDGLKIVIDCAHGAAYKTAPRILWELGAEIIELGVAPNGLNINDGVGATATDRMCRTVVETGASLGIALDGDADRLIMADEAGRRIDGDQLMALIAGSWAGAGRLTGGAVVATVMSNLGLERYLAGLGLGLERTRVGDRYVVERMRERGCNLGGEQSGHIVMSDHATTGDGLLAALQVLAVLTGEGRPLSELAQVFEPVPQILKNVRFEASGVAPLEADTVQAAIRAGEDRLNGCGRLVIRKSGTEPVIRVMGEADDRDLLSQVIDDIVGAVARVAA